MVGRSSRTHFEDLITESLRLSGEDTQTSEQYDTIDMYRMCAIDVMDRRSMQRIRKGSGVKEKEGLSNPSAFGNRPCRWIASPSYAA